MVKIPIEISKRKRFVISSILLTLFIASTSTFFPALQNPNVAFYSILALCTYLLTLWSLKEDIKGTELITLFTIPVLYTIGTVSFMHILPERKLYRYPLILTYPISMYAIFHTNNIFNVAAIRTIQLLRAARAVAYLMTILTTYFVVTAVSTTIDNTLLKMCLYALSFLFICFQFFWSFDLGKGEGSKVRWYTTISTLLLAEIALLLQITPINAALEGLILITSMYCLLGISTHNLERKLTPRIATEYIVIATLIISLVYYTLPWTG